MSGELLSSKVVVVEEEPRVRGITAAPTSVAAAVGIAERGPIGVPVLCSSFEEYQTRYGGFTLTADMTLGAMGFFENGGTQLWCVRTCHHAEIAEAGTATAIRASGYLTSPGAPTPATVVGTAPAPFRLEDGDKLVAAVNGGADLEAVFHGGPAYVESADGPFALADGQTLSVRIDGGPAQPLAFAAADFVTIATATAKEVSTAINAQLEDGKAIVSGNAVRIVSDRKGTTSRVEVTGGTANTVLGFPVNPSLGTGNVGDVHAVTALEVQQIAEAAIAGVLVSTIPGGFLEIRTIAAGVNAQLQVRAATSQGFGLDTALHQGAA